MFLSIRPQLHRPSLAFYFCSLRVLASEVVIGQDWVVLLLLSLLLLSLLLLSMLLLHVAAVVAVVVAVVVDAVVVVVVVAAVVAVVVDVAAACRCCCCRCRCRCCRCCCCCRCWCPLQINSLRLGASVLKFHSSLELRHFSLLLKKFCASFAQSCCISDGDFALLLF